MPPARESQWQRQRRRCRRAAGQVRNCNGQSRERRQEAEPVDSQARHLDPAHRDADARRNEEDGHTPQCKSEWHRSCHDIPRMSLVPIVRRPFRTPADSWIKYLDSLVQRRLPFEWLDSPLSPRYGAKADHVLNSARNALLVIASDC